MDVSRYINGAVRLMNGGAEAHDVQIKAVHRLAYEKADTILVAPTAYGKRSVLHACYLLTAKIFIHIMPSMRVAKDEARAISREISRSKPIVVTEDLLATTNFFGRMRAQQYTHILVSPEFAASPKFIVELTRDPEFPSKIGFFVVHDLHMVSRWKDYYHAGIFLDSLRYAFPHVPWYACTAAFDHESQVVSPHIIGFDLQTTEYIRVPVDRPEISVTCVSISSEEDFGHLDFLLAGNKTRDIAKTVIYAADAVQAYKVCRSLWLHAQQLGLSRSEAKQVIQRYDVNGLTDKEKDTLITNLAGDTDCRIVVSAVSLSTGWDLPDIIRVVHLGFPMDGEEISVGEWWQRNGIVMRDMAKAQASGYMFGYSYTFATCDKLEEMKSFLDKCWASSLTAQNRGNASTGHFEASNDYPTTLEDHRSADQELTRMEVDDSEESDSVSLSAMSPLFDSSPRAPSSVSSHGDGNNVHRGEPHPRTLAWFAWKAISDYCWGKASEMEELTDDEYEDDGSQYYMDLYIQYAIGEAWSRAMHRGQEVPFTDEWDLAAKAPAIIDWDLNHGNAVRKLIEFCRNTTTMVHEQWQAGKLS